MYKGQVRNVALKAALLAVILLISLILGNLVIDSIIGKNIETTHWFKGETSPYNGVEYVLIHFFVIGNSSQTKVQIEEFVYPGLNDDLLDICLRKVFLRTPINYKDSLIFGVLLESISEAVLLLPAYNEPGYNPSFCASLIPKYSGNFPNKIISRDGYLNGKDFIEATYPVNSVIPDYFFPFDRRQIRAKAYDELVYFHSDGNIQIREYRPSVQLMITAPEWEEKASFIEPYDGNFVIDLKRPLSTQILTIVILAAAFIFIFFLPFINELSNFLEVAVGVLLGLWGIQNTIIPDYIEGTTIIDNLILILYVFLAFVILIRFAIRPIWQHLSITPAKTPELDDNQEVIQPPEPEPISTLTSDPEPDNSNWKIVFQMITAVSATITTILTAIIAILHFTRKKD